MSKPIVDDKLWGVVELRLPKVKRKRRFHPGCKPIAHRQALRHPVRAAYGDSLSGLAIGNGLRFRGKLLEALGGLATHGGVDTAAPSASHAFTVGRANRVVAHHCGQFFRASHAWGKKQAPTRPTDLKRAANTTSSRMLGTSHSQRYSRRPTPMM